MRALGELSAGLVHEVCSPLTVILARTTHLRGLLKTGELDPQQLEQSLEQIELTARHIEKVVLGVKALSRNTQEESFVRASLDEILGMTISLVRSKLLQLQIELRIEPLEQEFKIDCRPAQITQVLLNLLLNAVEAIEAIGNETSRSGKKWISIEIARNENSLELQIANSGPAIPEAIRSRVMEPHFTTKAQGTGLGLSISKQIMEAHQGELLLKSDELTCFLLRMPLAYTHVREAA